MNKVKKQKKENSVNTNGLEKLFKSSAKDEITTAETINELKLTEASQKYKVTERTILRWLKEGRLTGYKIDGNHGMEWRITGESKEYIETQMIEDEHTFMSTDDPSMTSKSVDSLITMIDKLSTKLESTQKDLQAASFRNGWLEAQLSTREEQLKLLEDKQFKATEVVTTPIEEKGWWKKFMDSLFTNNS